VGGGGGCAAAQGQPPLPTAAQEFRGSTALSFPGTSGATRAPHTRARAVLAALPAWLRAALLGYPTAAEEAAYQAFKAAQCASLDLMGLVLLASLVGTGFVRAVSEGGGARLLLAGSAAGMAPGDLLSREADALGQVRA
jgi:hypothetical protein